MKVTKQIAPEAPATQKMRSRAHRPTFVTNDPKDLRVVHAKMEADEKTGVIAPAPVEKKKPGRKSNAERARLAESATPTAPVVLPQGKKKLGRPFGSKNKSKAVIPTTTIVAAPVLLEKKKVGRKSNAERARLAALAGTAPIIASVVVPQEKKKRGRKSNVERERLAALATDVNLTVISGSQEAKGKPGRKPKPPTIDNLVPGRVTLLDYASMFAAKGVRDYEVLMTYVEETGVSISQAIGLLSGAVTKPREEVVTAFKLGTFRVRPGGLEHAQKVADMRLVVRDQAPGVYFKPSFTTALDKVISSSNFSDKQMERNLKRVFMGIEAAETPEAYMKQLKEIYDYKLPKKDRLQLVTN